MKKLLFLSLLVITSFALSAQTGTIVDKESYVQINYPNGDTVSVGKSQVVSIVPFNSEVFLMTSQHWGSDKITRIASLNYSTFGFSGTQALRTYLSRMFFNSYRSVFSYSAGSIDTVSYYAGDSLAYRIVFTYSDGDISEKSAPINE